MEGSVTFPMGDVWVEVRKREGDGKYNASDLLTQWNNYNYDSKTIKGFVDSESAFYAEFFGDRMPLFTFDEYGDLWLNESEFRDFLAYLSPELALVEWPCAQIKN